ncbi:MAG TPA: hypothetical protein VFW33_23195 [Gemmataceae bacterium]|nr:hypothetical protein [Gemmataceae bacterium]
MFQHWTEYTCVGCGGGFRYTTRRTRTQQRAWPMVKMRPCPTCGLYQPDMVGWQRAKLHLLIACGASAVTTFLGLIGAGRGLPEWRTTWMAAAVALLAFLGQIALLFWNPNHNPGANRNKAKGLLRQGRLESLRGETPDLAKDELPRPRMGVGTAFALSALALGIVPFASAELVRLALGWPLNREWYPAVVGPGDESRFYFPDTVSCLGPMWNGRADAELLNAGELGLGEERFEVTTSRTTWGKEIRFDDKPVRAAVQPWVDLRIPDAPQLGGKDLRVKLDLVVTFPQDQGTHFVNAQRDFTDTPVLRLADRPRAGFIYRVLCRAGTWGGAAWQLLASLVLMEASRSFRREAFPPKAYADREADDYEDEEDDPPRRRSRRRPRIRGDDD